ncbi:hypothetical protein QTP70_001779 [Hemibagrus guttatus]|uniref:Beta-1,4-galactosyltransferase n=1 Tax=Hemibagrus guttatus TaxID=175788 RepID=A0AAE0R6X8_9TELE|nr:hypothetical protein QTP70_001779 [Hemibagrus guttatus]
MSRLMLGRTLERVCKAVLLLCLVHFLIMMILYFDVYSQRFDIFSRFNNGRGANASRWPHHSYYNYSGARPNATFASYVPASEQLPPSGKPELNRTHTTPKPIPPCPEVPPGLGERQMKPGALLLPHYCLGYKVKDCSSVKHSKSSERKLLNFTALCPQLKRLQTVSVPMLVQVQWTHGHFLTQPSYFSGLGTGTASSGWGLGIGWELNPGLLHVGRLLIEFSSLMSMERVQRENPNVTEGGKYTPPDCRPKQKVAIIIPFRHREHHLKYWLHYLHPILRRQKIDYGIYIVNQHTHLPQELGEDTFNRAKLLNVGYTEALKDAEYDCFIFSDVDLIPMDDRNLYHCYDQPRHFAIAMDKFGFRLPYAGYFGGVSGLSKKQFLKINGFPNEYWGWGGEDDDIYNREPLKDDNNYS